jgi:nucleoside-diphosphate-sugar epimerase
MDRQPRALVTGGVGRLGSRVCRTLLNLGFEVTAFDVPTRRNRIRAAGLGADIAVEWGDIAEPDSVRRALEKADVVVHMAGLLPPYTDQFPELAQRVNVEGTRILVGLIRKQNARLPFVYTSSIAVFGATPHSLEPISVDRDPVHPEEVYARNKVESENLIEGAEIDYVILRLAPAFKLDSSAIGLIFRLPLDNRMEFCHPDDTALAVANAVLALPLPPAGAFSTRPYCVDWYDTRSAQELLQFQRKTLTDFCDELTAGFSRRYSPLFLPLMRRLIAPVFGHLIVRLLASRYGAARQAGSNGLL